MGLLMTVRASMAKAMLSLSVDICDQVTKKRFQDVLQWLPGYGHAEAVPECLAVALCDTAHYITPLFTCRPVVQPQKTPNKPY
jgi:hypothetical protein